jgi:hypothetical protein
VVKVTTPVPAGTWAAIAAADPTTTPFQTPAWRDVVHRVSGWQDASRLYETPDGRQLVLMLARRGVGPLAVAASWPAGWGAGGMLAPGGVRPEEAALVWADLAGGGAVSVSVRPGFEAAGAWAGCACDTAGGRAFAIPRAVHVAHFGGESFDEYWERRVSARHRRAMRTSRRHADEAGVEISSGNSPELVDALYEVYLRWIDWRAAQRKVPRPLARWQARRVEPHRKFAAAAAALGEDCRIWVARWQGRPVGATVSLYAGESAIGWRAFTDRSIPTRFRLFEIMLTEALRHACESGCRYLEMGESVGRTDLASVKARFGCEEHGFAEYCAERVPLTAGRMAFQRLRRRGEAWVTARGGTASGGTARGSTARGSTASGSTARGGRAGPPAGPRGPA